MQDRFSDRIDDKLYADIPERSSKPQGFELELNKCFKIITEDINQYIKIINHPWGVRVDKIIDHLRSLSPEELNDWIDALRITVVDKGIQNRWTMGLVLSTKRSVQLSDSMKQSIDYMISLMDATKLKTAE